MKNIFLIICISLILFSTLLGDWIPLPPIPYPTTARAGAGITYGRGYIFLICGRYWNYFYAYNIKREHWQELSFLPVSRYEIYCGDAITYGKGGLDFEKIFVVLQLLNFPDSLFLYSFTYDTGCNGRWSRGILLPREIPIGNPAVGITFRPVEPSSPPPPNIIISVLVGELYLAIENEFYCLPFKKLLAQQVCDDIFPPNDTILDAIEILFSWKRDTMASYYQLQVDDNLDFSSPIIDIISDKNIFSSNIIFTPGIYYWRTRSSNSLWSEIRKFTIDYNWLRKTDIPESVKVGASIAYHKEGEEAKAESVYCLIGGGRENFYCYSIHSNYWRLLPLATSPLRQNAGSSLTSCYQDGPGYYRKLLAVFGHSNSRNHHYIYKTRYPGAPAGRWIMHSDQLPAILDTGASITFDPINKDAYLIIGRDRNSFYVNPSPGFEEDDSIESGSESSQLQNTILAIKKKFFLDKKGVKISYLLSIPSYVEISVYNFYGEKVKSIFKGKMEKGEHQLIWNKKNEKGRNVSSGVYFIMINLKEKQEKIKVIIN